MGATESPVDAHASTSRSSPQSADQASQVTRLPASRSAVSPAPGPSRRIGDGGDALSTKPAWNLTPTPSASPSPVIEEEEPTRRPRQAPPQRRPAQADAPRKPATRPAALPTGLLTSQPPPAGRGAQSAGRQQPGARGKDPGQGRGSRTLPRPSRPGMDPEKPSASRPTAPQPTAAAPPQPATPPQISLPRVSLPQATLTEAARAANDRLARAMAGTGDPSGLIETLVGARDINPDGFRAEYADLLDRYRLSLPENRQDEFRLFRAQADRALGMDVEAEEAEEVSDRPLPSERFYTGIDPYPRYNTLDAPTEATAARRRTRDHNYEAAIPYFEELRQENGIEAQQEEDGQITLDFGDGVTLQDLEPGEAGRMAALMLDSPEDRQALRDFAADEVDLDTVATRLSELYRKAEDLEIDDTQELPTSAEGGLSAEERAELYRLETLYLAEEARRNGGSHDEVMWLLDSGFAPDPLAAEKAVTRFVLSILPGTGEAVALRDAGVDLLTLQAAARNGEWTEAAKSGGLLALSGLGLLPIPGLSELRPAARLLDRSTGGGATRTSLRDWILDQATSGTLGQGGTHRSRLELAALERNYERGVGEKFSAKTLLGEDIWSSLPKEIREDLSPAFSRVQGALGEDLVRLLLNQSGFVLRTDIGQKSYRVRMPDGRPRMRYHDAVAQNEAMNFFGLYLRPSQSRDGSTVNFEVKMDGATKSPDQIVKDKRVVEQRYRERIESHDEQNPPVSKVYDLKVINTQLPEGQLADAIESRLRGEFPDDVVDQLVAAIRAHDLISRHKGAGVNAVPIGVLIATVFSSLPEEDEEN